jgi:hypothetical protein
MEAPECPVCLEPLTGTVVTLGCCHNRVHIQCYLEKCPLCRAQLPKPEHVVVPIPVPAVPPPQTRAQKLVIVFPAIGSLFAVGLVMVIVNTPRG